MNKSNVGLVALDFANMSGGVNSSLPQHAIGEDQVYDSVNALIERRGVTKAPGYTGISNDTPKSVTLGSVATGFFNYKQSTGADAFLSMDESGEIFNIKNTGRFYRLVPTSTFAGSGQAYGCQLLNKYFVVNGTSFIKVEVDATTASGYAAYQVGITPPSGSNTAVKYAGGSLDVGTYQVYAGYARKVSGVNVLYSNVQSLGAVTLSGSDLTIRVTLANSNETGAWPAYTQTNNKIIWMTDAGGTAVYFYHETDDNTTTTIDITSTALRNASIDMSIVATPFYIPPAFTGIFAFDNRIFGWTGDNILYYSLKAGTVYDLEKFVTPALATGNRITCPANIINTFSVGDHLFINTALGIWALPYADLSSKLQKVSDTLYFKHPRTIVEYNNLAWGVTNDGIRYFDGNRFSDDLSKDIRKYVDDLNSNATSTFLPNACVYRRGSKRTEYHLCYKSSDDSFVNSHLVLNMDYWNQQPAKYPWERWSIGFFGMQPSSDNVFHGVQVSTSYTMLCKENGDIKSDIYFLDNTGTFISTATVRKLYIKSKLKIPDLSGMCRYDKHSILATFKNAFTITLWLPDKNNASYLTSIANPVTLADSPILDADGITFPFVLPIEYPVSPITKTALVTWSKMMFVEIRQEVLDDIFQLYEYTIYGATERSVMT